MWSLQICISLGLYVYLLQTHFVTENVPNTLQMPLTQTQIEEE